MTRTNHVIQSFTLAALVVALVVGCSTGDSEQADSTTTAPAVTAGSTTTAPAVTTPESLKLAVFERSYSECASTEFEPLAAKYKVADKTRPAVATAVAREWAEFMRAGPDAIADGRSGCLQGFDDR